MAELKFEQIFKGLRQEIERLKTEIKTVDKDISTANLQDLNKRLTQLVSINRKLDTTAKQRLKTQQQLSVAYQKEAAARQRAVRETKQLAKAEEVLEAITRKQVKSINDLQLRTNALVTKRKLLDRSTKEGRKQFARYTKEINRNTNTLKKHDKQIGRSQRNVGNYASAFKNLLGAAGAGVGIYGVIRLFGSMIKVFKNFEKANKKLQAILGVTSKDIQSLSKQAKTLGSVTAFTATEITGLQTELAKLGFTLPQIEASTEGILSLAAATGTELAEAATLAGSAIRIFGLDASESARVADVLALSTSKSALDMSKLSAALPIVGTTAKQAGLNIEQTTALLGTLADRGIDASTSATSLRNIFLELSKKGLTFNEAMTMINDSTDKSKTAMDLFGKRAATAGVILSETAESTLNLEIALNNANGAAKDMADTMLDNLAGDITIAQSAWEGFVLSIESGSGKISGSMRKMAKITTFYLNTLKSFNEGLTVLDSLAAADERVTSKLEEYNKNIKANIELGSKRAGIGKNELEITKIRIKRIGQELKAEAKRLAQVTLAAAKEPRLYAITKAIQVGKVKILKDLLDAERLELETTYLSTKAIEDNTKATNDNIKSKTTLKEVIKPKKQEQAALPGGVGATDTTKSLIDEGKRTVDQASAEINKAIDEAVKNANQKGSFLERIFGTKDLKEIAQSALNYASNFLSSLGGLFDTQLSNIQNLLSVQDEQIAKTKEQLDTELDRINELKAAGAAYDTSESQRLQNKLADEEKARQETLASQKKLHLKQQRMQIAQANMDIASAIIAVWAGKGHWILKLIQSAAVAATGAINIANIKSQKFAGGTDSVQLNGNPSGVDTVPAHLTAGEMVVQKPLTDRLPKGFTRFMLPEAAHMYMNSLANPSILFSDNSVANDHLSNIEKNTRNNKVYDSNGILRQEIKNNMTINYA